ncbi:hypothetical protein IKG31_02425 [Candidatus Saccharibacteria bacterium]|nr:hypothetical protein [Candidatus Saccharibacteria bacterium]
MSLNASNGRRITEKARKMRMIILQKQTKKIFMIVSNWLTPFKDRGKNPMSILYHIK